MFEIGDDIVCVRTHSQKFVVKDKIYKVLDLNLCKKCKTLSIDIGSRINFKEYDRRTMCCCGHVEDLGRQIFIHHQLFKKLSEMYNEEIAELLKENAVPTNH